MGSFGKTVFSGRQPENDLLIILIIDRFGSFLYRQKGQTVSFYTVFGPKMQLILGSIFFPQILLLN